jgi:hemerythrin-like metal-binding protein
MSAIFWNEQMSFGLKELDASHEDILNGLALLNTGTRAEFRPGFARLIAAVEKDFAGEEIIMEELRLEDLHYHREQHARILGVLHHAYAEVLKGDIDFGRKFVATFPDLMLQHMATLDAALALAVRTKSGGMRPIHPH